uniref:Uncharacterized protein n=1 Tax=Panagrolaimus superbus TaxID=310955 RepID=A0A914YB66_9BILA
MENKLSVIGFFDCSSVICVERNGKYEFMEEWNDIIKIMSMPADKIEVDKNWKFAITKDSENPVLLEFDNFCAEKKFATPAFLMALLLKEHFKIIKEKVGEKPNEIAFCFFDQFNDCERKRVEEGLTESCQLLKPSVKCCFIKV